MLLSAQESRTRMRSGCGSEEKDLSRPTVRRLCRLDSQISSKRRNCARSLIRGLKSRASAIASGMPKSRAEGQPSARGRKVSQMDSSARFWRRVRFKGLRNDESVFFVPAFLHEFRRSALFQRILGEKSVRETGIKLAGIVEELRSAAAVVFARDLEWHPHTVLQ